MNIRIVKHSDLPIIQSMNEAAVPHVNSISLSDFEKFIGMASFFLVIEDGNKSLSGFIIVLGPGQPYDSLNYHYFSKQYEAFDYVDRIVIDESARGRGYGKALYAYLMKHSKQPRITCEVNIDPPNPDSLKFHANLGFTEVNQQRTEEGKKAVSLQVWESEEL